MKVEEDQLLNGLSQKEYFDRFEPDFELGSLKLKDRDASSFKTELAYKMWRGRCLGKVIGSKDSLGYITVYVNGRKRFAHRVLWFMYTGCVPDKIDHKDGNPSNNRISNLRDVSHRTNLYNTKVSDASTTKLTGVHYYKARNNYQAHITIEGKTKFLGYFDSAEEAYQARLEAEKELSIENFRRGDL